MLVFLVCIFFLCAGLSILVLGLSSASGPCGPCRRMRSYWLLMVMITNQQGRMALRPLIGISRSCRSFSRDNRLPLANKDTNEFFWKIKQPSLPVLQLYSPAALWHLISPAAANSRYCKSPSGGIELEQCLDNLVWSKAFQIQDPSSTRTMQETRRHVWAEVLFCS